MKMMSGKVAAMAALLLAHHVAWAAEVDEAREALQTTDEDVTQEKKPGRGLPGGGEAILTASQWRNVAEFFGQLQLLS